jgi:hypothetical protein
VSTTDQSPGEHIAAALRRSPIYVDPGYGTALPQAKRAVLLAHMKRSATPIFLLVVPLIAGGTWSDSADLAGVVHDRLARDGIYITLDAEFGSGLDAYAYGLTQPASDNATNAAWAVGLQPDMNNAPLSDRLLRCVDLITTNTGTKAYTQATAALNHGNSPKAPVKRHHEGSDTLPIVATGAGVVVLAAAGLAIWRWRRTAAIHAAAPQPHRVLTTATQANTDTVRTKADQAVTTLGEKLDASTIDTTDDAVRAAMTTALDAYQAAEKVLDSETGLPDLAGVLVLVAQGTAALSAAEALAAGRPAPPFAPLCFFNPLHGPASVNLNWRPLGSRKHLPVQTCRACAKATRARDTPEVLPDGDVPYYEVPPEESVWAETGYGQFRDDLIVRILRGDRKV